MAQPAQTEMERLDALAEMRETAAAAAKQKITKLLRGYPRDAPAEFVLFGYAGVKVTLGEMKDAFGIE
jgi:hypothetical protein